MVSKNMVLGKMAKVEGKLDAILEEIKALLHGMAIQNNESMRQMTKQKGGVNKGFIVGNLAAVLDDVDEFKKLKQTGPLMDYLQVFELLLDKAQISERQALSCFLAGLE